MLFCGEIIEELVLISNTVFIVIYIIGSVSGMLLLDKKKIYPAVSLIVCVAILLFVGVNVIYPILIVAAAVVYTTIRNNLTD